MLGVELRASQLASMMMRNTTAACDDLVACRFLKINSLIVSSSHANLNRLIYAQWIGKTAIVETEVKVYAGARIVDLSYSTVLAIH